MAVGQSRLASQESVPSEEQCMGRDICIHAALCNSVISANACFQLLQEGYVHVTDG